VLCAAGLYVACVTLGCPGSNANSGGDAGTSGAVAGSHANSGGDAGTNNDETTTHLSGTLGALGEIKPTVSSFVIANSGEILIYMSSAQLTCSQIMVSRWLGGAPAGAQIVEVVVPASKASGTVAVGDGAEVNYAEGGKSSAYEKSASSGSVTFTTTTPKGVFEGMFNATYAKPSGAVVGSFHAEYCDGGQGY
jgi:hypothetical protein